VSSAERKGKAPPSERGRGGYCPHANHERVTSGASERRGNRASQRKSKNAIESESYEDSRKQIQETSVKESVDKGEFFNYGGPRPREI